MGIIDDLRAKLFPQLSQDAEKTSDPEDDYNCIAWAAGDTEIRWWPVDRPTMGVYWPLNPPEDTVEGFVAAFKTLGYERCEDGLLEDGFEKVALYIDAKGEPTHMARQLASGHWTSKIGVLDDIRHPTLDELCGDLYGTVECFMKRPIVNAPDAAE